jgi:hypothetical protein
MKTKNSSSPKGKKPYDKNTSIIPDANIWNDLLNLEETLLTTTVASTITANELFNNLMGYTNLISYFIDKSDPKVRSALTRRKNYVALLCDINQRLFNKIPTANAEKEEMQSFDDCLTKAVGYLDEYAEKQEFLKEHNMEEKHIVSCTHQILADGYEAKAVAFWNQKLANKEKEPIKQVRQVLLLYHESLKWLLKEKELIIACGTEINGINEKIQKSLETLRKTFSDIQSETANKLIEERNYLLQLEEKFHADILDLSAIKDIQHLTPRSIISSSSFYQQVSFETSGSAEKPHANSLHP